VTVSVSGLVPDFMGAGCEKPAPGTFRGIDWLAVRQVDVRVRHGDFTPNLIRLREGGAYVMRISNRDDGTVRFNAREFFAGIKIQRIVVADRELDAPCPRSLAIPSRQVAEVRFIAERDGRYEFEDSFLPPFLTAGAAGIIIVEEPLPPMVHVQILPPLPPEGIPTFPLTPAATPPAATPAPGTPTSPATPAATPPVVPPVPPVPVAPTTPAVTPPAALPVLPEPESPASPAVAPAPEIVPDLAPPPESQPESPVEKVSDDKDDEAGPVEIPGLPTLPPPGNLFSR
jgi:hypothetical protein